MSHAEGFRDRLEGRLYVPEPGISVITEHEFHIDFAQKAREIERGEIFSEAMVIFPDNVGMTIANIIKNGSREAKRTLVTDAYSRLAVNNKVVAIASFNPFERKQLKDSLEKYEKMKMGIVESGGEFVELNKPDEIRSRFKKIFPFIKTDHTKASYVYNKNTNEATFYLHTSNHEDQPRINMVLKYEGPLALALMRLYKEMHENPPKSDYSRQLDENTWVYVDAGIPGKSIILDTASALIGNASESALGVTLMHPDGKFAAALQEKYDEWKPRIEGKEMQVITTDFQPEMPFETVGGTFYLVNKVAELQARKAHYNFPVLPSKKLWGHSKSLITDHKWLFIGSHNFASSGVKAGTREWQLLTKDPVLVAQAEQMFRDYKEFVENKV